MLSSISFPHLESNRLIVINSNVTDITQVMQQYSLNVTTEKLQVKKSSARVSAILTSLLLFEKKSQVSLLFRIYSCKSVSETSKRIV